MITNLYFAVGLSQSGPMIWGRTVYPEISQKVFIGLYQQGIDQEKEDHSVDMLPDIGLILYTGNA